MATAPRAGAGTGVTRADRTPAQWFALVFGAVYLLVGVLGIIVNLMGDAGFATNEGDKLIIFPVNYLHDIVHLLIGAAWVGAARAHNSAKAANTFIGAAYLLVAVLGFAGILDFLAIDDASSADNFLHLASGALSLYFGTAGAERRGETSTRAAA